MNDQPPQKLSVHDADYDHDISSQIIVTLDGQPQDSVISYDVKDGWVYRYCKVDNKYVFITKDKDFETETVNGVVGVSWK